MRNHQLNLPAGAFFALFAVSGCAGLVYESIWTHYLKLFLGHAAYAQTLVLAIFMGGMALGAWLTGAYSGRVRNMLLGYAIVEGLIGVAALVFHSVFVAATDYAYDAVLPGLGSPMAAHLFKWTLASLFILPQSVLLGMTFPLMSAGVLRRHPGTPGRTLATLYFANSLGAAVGVLASGFLLIGLVGLPGTMLTAGLVNVALALLVGLIARGPEADPAAPPAAPPAQWGRDRVVWLMLVVAGATGAASFLYEIAWIRMLSLVLGSSTHSFELMLAAFILGLALGGYAVRRRVDGLVNPTRFLAYVQLLMGGFALATIPVYGQSFEWMSFLLSALARTAPGYAAYNVGSSAIALVIMLPATFLAGMTLPLLTFVLLKRGHGEKTIGSVYAANTIGAILGILAAVHLLMPAVGVKGVIVAGAAVDLALGVWLLVLARPTHARVEIPAGALAAGAAVLVVALGVQLDPLRLISGVYRTGKAALPEGTEVLFRRDGKTATISLVGTRSGALVIATNGKTDAKIQVRGDQEASPDEVTMTLAGALPLLHNPSARTAANIGFGSGLTTHVLLSTPQLERVDSVEIEPFMVEAARQFGDRVGRAYHDPRSHIHFEDAKTFFAVRAARYDIVVSEPSNPWVSGVASLFSTEFYARIRTHLNPNGVFVQWLQGYEIDMPLVASILKALDPHFADYAIYGTNDGDLLIVASRDGELAPLDEAMLRQPGLAAELARVKIERVEDLRYRRLAGKALARVLVAGYPVPQNSDYFPYLDQNAARARFVNRDVASDISPLRAGALPIVEMLERRVARGETRVTRDEDFLPIALVSDAMRARDALLGRAGWGGVPEDNKRDWSLIGLMIDRCDRQADWGPWRAALRRVSATTLARLTPDDADRVLARIRSSGCVARLPVHNGQWLDLVHAVGTRDAPRMTTLATALLSSGDAEERLYLVQVAMLGALVRGQRGEALAAWQRFGQSIDMGRTVQLDTALLLTLAQPAASRHAALGPGAASGAPDFARTSMPR